MFYKLDKMYKDMKWVALILVIALGVLGAMYDRFLDTPGGIPQERAARMAPDFTFMDFSEMTHTLADFRGKVVVINFWATWCAPCIIEFPPMLKFAANNDVVLIALSSDEDSEAVEQFLTRLPKTAREHLKQGQVFIGLDPGRKITRELYGTKLYPESYIIAPDGTIARKFAGVVEWDDPLLKKFVSGLVLP